MQGRASRGEHPASGSGKTSATNGIDDQPLEPKSPLRHNVLFHAAVGPAKDDFDVSHGP
jgi:hypothetical protein